MQWEDGGEGIKPSTQACDFTGFFEFLMDSGLLGAWKGYLKHVLSDGGESFGHLRNLGAGQHSKPKDICF